MINEKQNLSLQLDLQWNDGLVNYKDSYFLIKTNFWRDFYPAVLDYKIKRAELNQSIQIDYKAGDLLQEEFSQANLKTIPLSKFDQYFKGAIPVIPVVGRFYPRGMIEGVAGCFKMDDRPFRVIGKTADTLEIDLNHPLANFSLQLTVKITDIFDANQQNGGRCNEVAELITTQGPGLQTLLKSHPTEFFQEGMPFLRKIEDDDSIFYAAIETKPSVDQAALDQLKQFYTEKIQDNSKVLDFMCGSASHLPDKLQYLNVTGLGLNKSDLKANLNLDRTIIHDVNNNPQLPFENNEFDAIICSFSVEYITQPQKVFQQLARILKPGGLLIISFSEHYFKKKVISLWEDVHSFERMGIVLEYFRQCSEFENLNSESIRGLIKYNEDPFISKNVYSCPLFIISGNKKGSS
ncbi:MAG: class I SAM-dependent methyltransferase [gamma proteobacterium symbiont of Taylorina sp.]|nr:class I SAM-dependent methyltransferase [gamma proteobacterium symbiont of Taylorina sp.]